jgi:purine/pyrimidine-nucleoside phosphorylase
MSEFENVSVVKAANIYFGGKVISRTLRFPNGERKTLGIMQPGDYRFDTATQELMEILSGDVEVRLPGAEQWQRFGAGETFEVVANATFDIRVLNLTDYCCSYLD